MSTQTKFDTRVTINGGEAAVKALQSSGIDLAVGIVGSSIIEIFNLLPRAGIRYVGVRHEQVGTLIAEGYARVTQKPAVCLAQNGGGVTNMVTGAANAFRSGTPIVMIGGTPSTSELDRGTFQEADQLAAMSGVTKWAVRVSRADRIHEYVKRAIRIASAAPMGPTYVEIPREFLYDQFEVKLADFEPGDIYAKVRPDRASISSVIEALAQARHPVLIAGGGVHWAKAGRAIEDLAAEIRAPIVTTYYHNDVVSGANPWVMGALGRQGAAPARRVMQGADCIIAIGTRLDPFTFLPINGETYYPENAKLIHVDIDPANFGRNRRSDLGIVSDAREFAVDLRAELLNGGKSGSEWDIKRLVDLTSEWRNELQGQLRSASDQESETMSNLAAWSVLQRCIPEGAMWVNDIGGTPSYAYQVPRYVQPASLLAPGYLGSLGFCVSSAIGARLADREREIVGVLGDGSLTMMWSAMITAVDNEINLLVVAFDNGCWGAEWRNQQQFNNEEYVGTELINDDLPAMAAATGWQSWSATTTDELEKALNDARGKQGPRLVIVKVDKHSLPKAARVDALKVAHRGLYTSTSEEDE